MFELKSNKEKMPADAAFALGAVQSYLTRTLADIVDAFCNDGSYSEEQATAIRDLYDYLTLSFEDTLAEAAYCKTSRDVFHFFAKERTTFHGAENGPGILSGLHAK